VQDTNAITISRPGAGVRGFDLRRTGICSARIPRSHHKARLPCTVLEYEQSQLVKKL